MSSSTPRPGFFGTSTQAALDLQRLLRQALAVLPDPVRVDRGDAPGRGGADVREHRERDVEVVVRVRAPGQAPVAAGLRHAHRAGHGPEVRVGERDVDRLQRQRMRSAGASRSRPCWSRSAGRWRGGTRPSPRGRRSRPRRRTGLRRRRRTPRMSRIRRIASFSSQPPFGSSVTRACGKRSCSAVTASISSSPRSTPPFSLKSLKP